MPAETVGTVLVLLGLAGRVVWQFKPKLPYCIFFWGCLIIFHAIQLTTHTNQWKPWATAVGTLGCLMNALVTLLNGGMMPIIGSRHSPLSVWRPAQPGDRLLWLADRQHLLGCSPGDILILASLIIPHLLK